MIQIIIIYKSFEIYWYFGLKSFGLSIFWIFKKFSLTMTSQIKYYYRLYNKVLHWNINIKYLVRYNLFEQPYFVVILNDVTIIPCGHTIQLTQLLLFEIITLSDLASL